LGPERFGPFVYVYLSQRQNTAKIQRDRHRQTDKQYIDTSMSQYVLVLKCSYTTDVKSPKFVYITETPYNEQN